MSDFARELAEKARPPSLGEIAQQSAHRFIADGGGMLGNAVTHYGRVVDAVQSKMGVLDALDPTGTLSDVSDARTRLIRNFGRSMGRFASEAIPEAEKARGHIAADVAGGLGTTAALAAAGGGLPGGALRALTIAGIGGLSQAEAEFEQARLSHADPTSEEAHALGWKAALPNYGIGALDVALEPVLGRWDSLSGGALRRFLTGAALEGGTEALQQSLSNVVASETYDQDREILEGVVRSGEAGGLAGGLFNVLFGLLPGKGRGPRTTGQGSPEAQPSGVEGVQEEAPGSPQEPPASPSAVATEQDASLGINPDTPRSTREVELEQERDALKAELDALRSGVDRLATPPTSETAVEPRPAGEGIGRELVDAISTLPEEAQSAALQRASEIEREEAPNVRTEGEDAYFREIIRLPDDQLTEEIGQMAPQEANRFLEYMQENQGEVAEAAFEAGVSPATQEEVEEGIGRFAAREFDRKVANQAVPETPPGAEGRVADRTVAIRPEPEQRGPSATTPKGNRLQRARAGEMGFREFIQSQGGLQASPDLERFTAKEGEAKSLPGFAPTVRKQGGMTVDDALERAVDAGFFPGKELGDLSQADLEQALDEDIHSTTDTRQPTQLYSGLPSLFRTDKALARIKEKAKSLVSVTDADTDIPSERFLGTLQRKLQDKFAPVRRLQKGLASKAEGAESLSESRDVSQAETLFVGRTKSRIDRLDRQFSDELKNKLQVHEISLDEAGEYVYALHAPDRNALIAKRDPKAAENGKGSGLTDMEAAEIRARYESDPRAQGFREIQKLVRSLSSQRLDGMVADGLISQETANKWREEFGENYVPLKTLVPGKRLGLGSGFNVRGPEAKRAKGRASTADNPIIQLLADVQEAIVRGEKNRVNQTLYRLIESQPESPSWKISKGVAPTAKYAANGELSLEERLDASLAPERTVGVKIDGVQHYMTFAPDAPGGVSLVARAIKNMGEESIGNFGRVLQRAMRTFSAANTSWNPEFIVTNIARDLQTANINIQEQGIQSVSRKLRSPSRTYAAAKAMYHHLKGGSAEPNGDGWAEAAERFTANGGKVDWFHALSATEHAEAFRKDLEQLKDPDKTLWASIKNFGALVDDMNSAVENAARLNAFRSLVEAGVSEAKAAALAKDLTVNFNRRGEWSQLANLHSLFFNAGVQGTARMFAGLGRSPKVRKVSLAIAGMGLTLDLINRALAGEDEDGENFYDKLPEWEKQRKLILMLPPEVSEALGDSLGWLVSDKPDGGVYLSLPMPWGYNVFHSWGRQIGAVSSGVKGPGEAAWDSATSAMDAFNPLGGEATILQTITPFLLDPIAQLSENVNFTGTPIVKEASPYDQSPPPKYQIHWNSTKAPFKGLSRWLNSVSGGTDVEPGAINISPDLLEHVAEHFGGGVLKTGTRTFDTLAGPETLNNIPFVRTFIGQPRDYYIRSRFYDNADDLKRLEGYIRDYRESGRSDRASSLLKENQGIWTLRSRLKALESRLTELRKREGSEEQIEKLQAQFNKAYLEASRADAERN